MKKLIDFAKTPVGQIFAFGVPVVVSIIVIIAIKGVSYGDGENTEVAEKPEKIQHPYKLTSCDHSLHKTIAWVQCWQAVTRHVPIEVLGYKFLSKEWKLLHKFYMETRVKDGSYLPPDEVKTKNVNDGVDLSMVWSVPGPGKMGYGVDMPTKVLNWDATLKLHRVYTCTFTHDCRRSSPEKPLRLLKVKESVWKRKK